MNGEAKILDVVAVLDDLPAQGLARGQVGTVVELLPGGDLVVEFVDDLGRTYAEAQLPARQVMILRYRPGMVA